ncbi:unnamed protein product [Bemisia tabaci]|uniref:Uncharacterized protein n=1 Tax=Bemisia tabaci TaxID=7038 RepID=A0A9P0A303_BEMTA|nr:unnamed protein product [Bemisia tabaci]
MEHPSETSTQRYRLNARRCLLEKGFCNDSPMVDVYGVVLEQFNPIIAKSSEASNLNETQNSQRNANHNQNRNYMKEHCNVIGSQNSQRFSVTSLLQLGCSQARHSGEYSHLY